MSHEEAQKALDHIMMYETNQSINEYTLLKGYIATHTATIRECISLLAQSGENTKAIVAEKLRGIVE